MKMRSPNQKQIPLDIVGSTAFGRYPKISIEQTFNMIISDDWLVPYAGYKKVAEIAASGQGRGIYASNNLKQMIAVIDNNVYTVNQNIAYQEVGSIDTFDGDVFIDENNAGQVAICDKKDIWIFNPTGTPKFQKASLDFLPGYVSFQNGYFIAPDLRQAQWRLSDFNNGLSWPDDAPNVGTFQTKPNKPVAAIPFPGKGNLLMVFGEIVAESWFNTGQQLFPYQKNTYQNSDYGCLNAATIAASDKFIVWLGVNEKSGPAIMLSDGGEPQQISTDGINFKLALLSNPKNAYGFLFKQDGHLIYQLSFPDDRFSLLFDFETKKFFTPTDRYMSYHIAKRVVSFNDSYYFVSFNDGNLYELNSKYNTYDGEEIPRVRVCKSIRMPDSSRFIVNNLTFPLEQGNSAEIERIDFSFSVDGGQTFTGYEGVQLNRLAHRQNRIDFWNKGMANDFIPQFRFWGQGRFVLGNGVTSIYQ